jgi:two-component system osmolarity sensor histidine kinase EnvZ
MSWLKRLSPRGLFGRSLLIIVMPLVIVQIVATWVLYDRHWETITRRLANAVAGDIGTIVELRISRPAAAVDDLLTDIAMRNMEIAVAFESGIKLGDASAEPEGLLQELLTNALNERVRRPYRLDTENRPRDVEIRVELPDGVLTALVPRKRLASSTTHLLTFWSIGTSLVVLAIAIHMLRRQIRPIRRLASAADSFGRGVDVPDFKPEGAQEIRLAARAFLLMRERIRRQIAQRTEMLAGVSHDLRTPLTRMKLQLAVMGDSPDAAGLKNDIAEMERMIEGYLAFVRGEGAEVPVPTRLDALLTEVIENARRNGGEVTLAVPAKSLADLTPALRPDAFRRCIANLVSNACRHAQRVAVAAQRREREIDITVDDDGPGIPEAEREVVFRPFFRREKSRNPATGGIGLGLTIARDVARGHGGDIVLEDSPLGGLRARVTVPI